MSLLLKLALQFVSSRASYTTRVWSALYLPVIIGAASGWSTRSRVEALLISIAIVAVYTMATWMHKKYLL